MRQKYLIIPTQTFSQGIKQKETLSFEDFPWAVQKFLKHFSHNVFSILDECSWIKTNTPMKEVDKSSRSRIIKLLEKYTAARCGLTGTLLTKSPLNILDPYQYLSSAFFKGESPYEIAENYCIMITLHSARGRRVVISQKEWDKARKRMINAYKFAGEDQLNYVKGKLFTELGLSEADCEHILKHRTYTPFVNVEQLMKRVESVTMTVRREDIFDITLDKKVYDPIMRPVKIGTKGLQLGKELVKLGFTDNLTLGRAPALELMHRLKDLCNGFEPIKDDTVDDAGEYDDEVEVKTKVRYEPLPENPKLDALEELLDELGDEQVVVWCSRRNARRSVIERLTKLGIPFAVYSGDQNAKEKAEAERMAKSGEARVFVASPGSASFGLNSLKDFNYEVWYCIDASVEKYHQAQHRILRGQSKFPKFAYMIYIKGSVEERNLRSVNSGVELLSASNSKSIFEFR